MTAPADTAQGAAVDIARVLADFAPRAIASYGTAAQTGMVREEVCELLLAIQRRERGRATDAAVIKECADALVMLWQLREMLGPDAVDVVIRQKVARQVSRMNAAAAGAWTNGAGAGFYHDGVADVWHHACGSECGCGASVDGLVWFDEAPVGIPVCLCCLDAT